MAPSGGGGAAYFAAPSLAENSEQFGFEAPAAPGSSNAQRTSAAEGINADAGETFGGFGNMVEVGGVPGMEL